MKKVLSLAALMCLISFVGCDPSDLTSDSIVGTWSLSYSGYSASVTFNSNGTGTAEVNGVGYSGTWSVSGNRLTVSGMGAVESGTYSVVANTLTVTPDDTRAPTVVLLRQ